MLKKPNEDNIFLSINGATHAGSKAVSSQSFSRFEVMPKLVSLQTKSGERMNGYVAMLFNRAGDFVRFAKGDDLLKV